MSFEEVSCGDGNSNRWQRQWHVYQAMVQGYASDSSAVDQTMDRQTGRDRPGCGTGSCIVSVYQNDR